MITSTLGGSLFSFAYHCYKSTSLTSITSEWGRNIWPHCKTHISNFDPFWKHWILKLQTLSPFIVFLQPFFYLQKYFVWVFLDLLWLECLLSLVVITCYLSFVSHLTSSFHSLFSCKHYHFLVLCFFFCSSVIHITNKLPSLKILVVSTLTNFFFSSLNNAIGLICSSSFPNFRTHFIFLLWTTLLSFSELFPSNPL